MRGLCCRRRDIALGTCERSELSGRCERSCKAENDASRTGQRKSARTYPVCRPRGRA